MSGATAAAAVTTAAGTNYNSNMFGDTTYTKVFVGGLAWETQKDTMKKYFEQFGDILEAVVITDKTTGRSKGYGFVTFREPEAAMRACVDAAPVIDGRRANCNLASLGVQRSKPSTPKHGGGGGGRGFRVMSSFQAAGYQIGGLMGGGGGGGTTFPTSAAAAAAAFPHYNYPIHQGIPAWSTAATNVYGYSPYTSEYTYPTSYYNVYGGGTSGHYPMYGAGAGAGGMMTGATAAAAFYPYLNWGDGSGTGGGGAAAATYTGGHGHGHGHGYGGGSVQHPHQLFQYSAINSSGGYPQHYANPMSLAPAPSLHSVCFAVPQA